MQDIQDVGDRKLPIRFLIHDRDAKFTFRFDVVFASESIETILTPYRCPKANAFAERWVRTAREECLDQLLIISEGHLHRVLAEYVEYYNQRRPHQGIGQRILVPVSVRRAAKPAVGSVVSLGRRDVLGGVIHDYDWVIIDAA